MGKRILIVFLVFAVCRTMAQKQATHWVFGAFGGIDFTCAPPQLEVSAFNGLEGGAAISDANGNLLFYTDANAVWNRNHQIMPNGLDLGGLCVHYDNFASSSQSSIIIPHPGNSNLYYIFTTDCAEDNFVSGLRYSIADISLQGGLGDITIKNQPLVAPTGEKVAAIYHQNGHDVWLVTHGINNNTFYSYLITNSGLNPTPVISNSGQVHIGGRGFLKFSPDGKKMVATSFIFGGNDGLEPELFHFDNVSGSLVSDFVIPTGFTSSFYSTSFSPDGSLLYLGCAWSCAGPIEQYNLLAGTPQQVFDSGYSITGPDIQVLGALQLGIDGKLYFPNFQTGVGSRYVGVIHDPNKVGGASHMQNNFLEVPCSMEPYYGLPNFIESYFLMPITPETNCPIKTGIAANADFSFTIHCDGKTVDFFDLSGIKSLEQEAVAARPPYLTGTWDFGDGTQANYHAAEGLTHFYNILGKYTVRLSINLYGCPIVQKEEIVDTKPTVIGFENHQSCVDFKIQFDHPVTNLEDASWHWNFGENVTDSVSSLLNPTHVYERPGSYVVNLTASTPCATAEFSKTIQVYELLDFSLGGDTTFCSGTTLTLLGPDESNAIYQWNNDSHQKKIMVQSEGLYWLTVSRDNCTFTDSVRVHFRDCALCKTINSFSLGSDKEICPGDTVELKAPFITGAEFEWSNGLTQDFISIVNPGTIWLAVTNGNCVTTDTVLVYNKDCLSCRTYPALFSLGNDTTLCNGDELVLKAPWFPNATINWNTGSKSASITVDQPGIYWVEAIFGNCHVADTLVVQGFECVNCEIIVPNVFTPNSDGVNDNFFVSSDCLNFTCHLEIYNRWGEIICRTNDQQGWDGKINGKSANSEIYFFLAQYTYSISDHMKITGTKKGWLSLVR